VNIDNAVLLEVLLGVGLFTTIILLLVFVILIARSKLVTSGSVTVTVNDELELKIPVGGKLMQGLADADLFVPSACGGGGTCGQCRVRVVSGGGAILATETSILNKREASEHYRLSCQVAVKQDMQVQVPDEVFGVKRSNDMTAPLNRIATLPVLSRNWYWPFRTVKNSNSGLAATYKSNARRTT